MGFDGKSFRYYSGVWTTICFRVDHSMNRLPPHLCWPFPSSQYTSRGASMFTHPMAPMWPSETFLTPSTVRCTPTSPSMNSICFLTREIKKELLVPMSSAIGDSETPLLTIRRSEVEWSGSISSWATPGSMVSPTLVVVQMTGGSMSPDHHYLCSNVTFNTDTRCQPFHLPRLLTCFAPKILYLSSACSFHLWILGDHHRLHFVLAILGSYHVYVRNISYFSEIAARLPTILWVT